MWSPESQSHSSHRSSRSWGWSRLGVGLTASCGARRVLSVGLSCLIYKNESTRAAGSVPEWPWKPDELPRVWRV